VSRTWLGTSVTVVLIAIVTVVAIFGINVIITRGDSSSVRTDQNANLSQHPFASDPVTRASEGKNETRTTGVATVLALKDRTAESNLRNALTAEKTYYTDQQRYTIDMKTLREIEPSLDWGGRISVVLVDRPAADGQAVCIATVGASGHLAVADVASGTDAGTYFARQGCSRNRSVIDTWASSGW
jgi:hypothetical protein